MTGWRISAILLGENTMLSRIKHEFEQGKTLVTFTSLQAAGQALGMVSPLVAAKLFSPELFGSFSLAKMIVFFFTSILVSSTQAPFIVFANQERTRSAKINKAFTVQCLFLTLSFCIFLALTLPLKRYIMAFAKISGWDLFFVVLAFLGISLKSFLCNLLMAMGQRVKNSLVELIFGSLNFVFILLLCLSKTISLKTVFLVYPLSAVLTVLIFIWSIDWTQLVPLSLEKRYLWDMLNFTKWVMLGATAIYFVNWGDYLVLRYYRSMSEIGAYGLGYQVFKGVVTLVFVVSAYFLPFVSQNITDGERMRNYLAKKRPRIFFGGIVLLTIFFLAVPYILKIYDKGYQGSSAVLRILLVGCIPILHTAFYVPILNSLKKYRFHQTVNFFHVLLNLFLDILLVPTMGLLGAAVATVLAYLCQALTFEIYFRVRIRKLLWE